MSTTSKKLTLTEVKRRVDELYTYRKTVKGGFRWDDPEHCQGLIDRLREAVIQAIAEGSKLPYALTRCIAELPRVDYGTIPTEPARTTVTKIAASSMYGVIKEAWKDDNKLSNCMTSEQAYAIGEYLGRGYDDEVPASAYPPGMTPEELREAFDRLLDRFTKMEKTIIDTAAVFAKICEEPTLSD